MAATLTSINSISSVYRGRLAGTVYLKHRRRPYLFYSCVARTGSPCTCFDLALALRLGFELHGQRCDLRPSSFGHLWTVSIQGQLNDLNRYGNFSLIAFVRAALSDAPNVIHRPLNFLCVPLCRILDASSATASWPKLLSVDSVRHSYLVTRDITVSPCRYPAWNLGTACCPTSLTSSQGVEGHAEVQPVPPHAQRQEAHQPLCARSLPRTRPSAQSTMPTKGNHSELAIDVHQL